MALLATQAEAQSNRPRAKFEPPDGKCLVFVGAGWDDEMPTYRRMTGDSPFGAKFFFFPDDPTCAYFWHNARKNCPPGGGLLIEYGLPYTTKGDLGPILRGDYDEAITNLGNAIKEWGGQVYFDIGYEFDHPDPSWPHRYTPLEFVRAYRKLHDKWDALGVKNVAYVWHTANETPETTWSQFHRRDLMRTEDFWPGDKYVDWVGASLYWEDQYRHFPAVANFAKNKGKPLMICESGLGTKEHDKPVRTFEDWHGPFLRFCERHDVKAIGYNNFPDEPRVAPPFRKSSFGLMPEEIVLGWSKEMKRDRYLHIPIDPADVQNSGKVVGSVEGPGMRGKAVASPPKPGGPLLNGKDLAGWTAIFKDGDAQADDEFSITSKGVLALRRARHEGYLKTEKPYQDFVLTFDWRFPKNGKMTGSGSGVLLGLGEEDGWLSHGFEVQIASRNCGDLWVYDGHRFDGQATEGRFGRVPKKAGAERQIGEWNSYEIRCEGRKIKVTLNGNVVNEATSDRPISGKIGLISQGTEVEFRDFRLEKVRR